LIALEKSFQKEKEEKLPQNFTSQPIFYHPSLILAHHGRSLVFIRFIKKNLDKFQFSSWK